MDVVLYPLLTFLEVKLLYDRACPSVCWSEGRLVFLSVIISSIISLSCSYRSSCFYTALPALSPQSHDENCANAIIRPSRRGEIKINSAFLDADLSFTTGLFLRPLMPVPYLFLDHPPLFESVTHSTGSASRGVFYLVFRLLRLL